MTKKNIFVVCTTCRDRRELKSDAFQQKYNIHFQEYDDSILDKILCKCLDNPPELFTAEATINKLIDFCKSKSIDAIISTDDYPGSIFASILSHHLELPGAHPQSLLTCQHKYYSRLQQQQSVPHATPNFQLINPIDFDATKFNWTFPFFVKPVKSTFSVWASSIYNHIDLENAVSNSLPSELFLQQMNWFLAKYSSFELNANYLLAEDLLQGHQVSLEGFVFDGNIEIIGIIDSVMFPGTISFERFVYPSQLSDSVQQRMTSIAKDFINAIQFNNAFFNMELMYNPVTDQIHIIEVNPRMCSQFADLYEKVDGYNTYQVLIDIALGIKPHIQKSQGKYRTAASMVLRRFDNKRVTKTPNDSQLAMLHQKISDLRIEIHISNGEELSTILQDGNSFRYGIINLGAHNTEELNEKFALCKQLLPFEFE